MPVAGLGLHFLLAILCAIHAVKTRQQTYWLLVLFSFPILGSIVYFFAIYFPNSRLERNTLKAVSAAAKAMDPERDIREARAAFEDTPTAQNQMRLAAALLDGGAAEEAAAQYEACMRGPFASDPDLRLGAARAFTECRRHDEALKHLQSLQAERPDFRAEAVGLLMARCYAGKSQGMEARAAFQSAEARFGTYEVKAEYAIWALAIGDRHTAERLHAELAKIASRWNPLTRELNERVQRRYDAARKIAGAS